MSHPAGTHGARTGLPGAGWKKPQFREPTACSRAARSWQRPQLPSGELGRLRREKHVSLGSEGRVGIWPSEKQVRSAEAQRGRAATLSWETQGQRPVAWQEALRQVTLLPSLNSRICKMRGGALP